MNKEAVIEISKKETENVIETLIGVSEEEWDRVGDKIIEIVQSKNELPQNMFESFQNEFKPGEKETTIASLMLLKNYKEKSMELAVLRTIFSRLQNRD